jgi:hypothetical protein
VFAYTERGSCQPDNSLKNQIFESMVRRSQQEPCSRSQRPL